ncbi:PEP-CTERM sorting domain-containing protein [Nostoc sp. DSM 114161]
MPMEASAIDSINNEINTFNAGSGSNLYNSSSFATDGNFYAEGNLLTNDNNIVLGNGGGNIPGGTINPFAGDAGSGLQQLIFDRLKLVLGDNFFKDVDKTLAGGTNPFLNGGNLILDSGSVLERSPFDPLREVLGDNIPFSNSGNTSNIDIPRFNESNAPVGNANRNFGKNNATVGNFNSDYGNNSATIGNGNWNFNNDNATIGNGNWLFGKDNTNLGNGNWYWDNGSNNSTLGNGNWHFGSDNSTIGNGNWDFGKNNTIIGNGNWVFTDGNTIVGNGNWLTDSDNATTGNVNNIGSLNLSPQEVKTDVNNLIDSLIGKIGQNFLVLTKDFDASSTQTFNRLISSKNTDISNSDLSNNIEQFLASLNIIPEDAIDYQPWQNPQSVPEPNSSVSLVIMGFVCLLLSIFKKQQRC